MSAKTLLVTGNVIRLSDEARHAMRCKPPSFNQLIKSLVSNDQKDVLLDRHQRWLAAYVLQESGFNFEYKGEPVD